MLKSAKLAAVAILGTLAISPVYAEDKPAAMVNGVAIPQSRIDMRVKSAEAQGQPDSPELRKAIREDMINFELILQASVKAGIDKQPEVVQQIEQSRQSVLVNAYVQDYIKKHPVSDEQLSQEYAAMKAKAGSKEYSARHILVETEAEAKAIIAKLGKKEKFEKLAEKSKDAGSAQRGGALGWAVPGNFVPPFAQAMLNLKKGEYTKEPVQTEFGWHVIKLDDERALSIPSFEDIKPQLQQRQQQRLIQKAISDLRATAKIE